MYLTSSFVNTLSGIKPINMGDVHPLEFVGRGSEIQLQVDENVN